MTNTQMAFYIIGAMVAIVAIGVAVASWSIRQKKEKKRREEAQEKIKQSMRKPCLKCGSMAEPILNSGNQYRCPNCSLMFASTRHNLIAEDK